jgi:hypothetical protein
LGGEKTRKFVSYDHHSAPRTVMGRARVAIKRWLGLVQFLRAYFKSPI